MSVKDANAADRIRSWYSENREFIRPMAAILVVIILVSAFTAGGDDGVSVEYRVTNYNCSNVEVQYITPNEDVKIVRNLGEGETYEIEVDGFQTGDLVGVSGVNRDSGYCSIIVGMYSWLYIDMADDGTAEPGGAISVAGTM